MPCLVFVEALAGGNLSRAEALRCGALLLAAFRDRCAAAPLHPAEAPAPRVLRLPPDGAAAAEADAPAEASVNLAASPDVTAAGATAAGAAREAGAEATEAGSGSGPAYGGGWLYAEDGPSATDENSAAVVMYQRGPDSLRTNALSALLTHMAKRDAFFELRTRQQLGYIVSMHGGTEHGVGYVELLVQAGGVGRVS
ncbi:hypothetical protein GPECTOR_27g691 [Gonium pectorale]|uniref:Uncharacterized protein n=1 Tax=Gonium pectorale TaxID=33097 RepID=A0A150GGM9_GONPE|nr:hypothetical protein GPECTOR_27g691 [Gonium pectorale]|eukprot:KXZ48520.1 hypothetical protein GPECTOR_27g691 [Gonium pectorale]